MGVPCVVGEADGADPTRSCQPRSGRPPKPEQQDHQVLHRDKTAYPAAGVVRTTRAVTLSVPPPASAALINFLLVASEESACASAPAISSSETCLVKPSVQSSRLSPGARSMSPTTGSNSLPPIALDNVSAVDAMRACSSVHAPSETMNSPSVWSRVRR